jgi:hypothetical protein
MDAHQIIKEAIILEMRRQYCFINLGGHLQGRLSPVALAYGIGETALELIVKNKIDITEFTEAYATELEKAMAPIAIKACALTVKNRKRREREILSDIGNEDQ